MPEIEMSLDRVDEQSMPSVCMHCGRDATHHANQTFEWYPWVPSGWNALRLAVGVPPKPEKATVSIPFCKKHYYVYRLRFVLFPGIPMLIGLGCVGSALLAISQGWALDVRVVAYACIAVLILSVGLLRFLPVFRPKKITADSIILGGVSAAFVEAYEERGRPKRMRW